MTTINPKLTAAITTIAILAPATSAQADCGRSPRSPHFATNRAERHWTPDRAKRPAVKFQDNGHFI